MGDPDIRRRLGKEQRMFGFLFGEHALW
jgi:hypothetical protein